MCGIAGIVYKNNKSIQEEIKAMTDVLYHRGPDGEGFYFGENFALGHRRLAIIDLTDAGHQPMEYRGKNGEYVIVYNGEAILNFIESGHHQLVEIKISALAEGNKSTGQYKNETKEMDSRRKDGNITGRN